MTEAIIRTENCYSFLTTRNESLKTALWRALRFREKGYYHSRLYKQNLWDGYIDFYKRETGRFLTGLLPEVTLALNHWGVKYVIKDFRNPLQFKVDEIDEQWLDPFKPKGLNGPFKLHDYQVDLTNQIIKYHRGVIQAPTSAGKTHIMLSILHALPPNTPTLILANKKSLVQQNYEETQLWGVPNVGRLYDKYKSPNMLTCATVQSLHKIEPLLPKIRALIVDEIHDMMSKVPKKFYNKMKACDVRVAVSATPFKFGGKHQTQKYAVKGYFGPIMRTKTAEGGLLTTKVLQDRDILARSKGTFWRIEEPQLPYEIYLDAVTKGIAENVYFHQIVTRLAKRLKGRTLILVERLAHGDTLSRMLPGSLWVQGKDNIETRKHVITQLSKATGNVIGIATQGIFNAGINVFVHNLINAAGGQADHQIVQRMGRGLRVAGDKEILDYHDFIFAINEYLEDHSWTRVKILKDEGHNVEVKDVNF